MATMTDARRSSSVCHGPSALPMVNNPSVLSSRMDRMGIEMLPVRFGCRLASFHLTFPALMMRLL